MKIIAFACAFATLLAAAASANEPALSTVPAEHQFEKAYEALLSADEARDLAKSAEAIRLYRSSLDAHMKLAARYPHWQPGVIKFRIAYCSNQLDALLKNLEPGAQPDEPATDMPPIPTIPAVVPATPPVPGNVDMGELRAEAARLMTGGRAEAARALLLDGLRQDPDSPELRLLISIAQCQAGSFDDAFHLASSLAAEFPSNAVARLVLGTVHVAAGRADDAEDELAHALRLDPAMPQAHYNMARLLLIRRPPDLERAAGHYRTAIKLGLTPDDSLEFLAK